MSPFSLVFWFCFFGFGFVLGASDESIFFGFFGFGFGLEASDESIFFGFFGFVFFGFGFGVEADNLQMRCIVRLLRQAIEDEMGCEGLFSR